MHFEFGITQLKMPNVTLILLICVSLVSSVYCFKRREDKTKCPHVRSIRNFDLNEVSFFIILIVSSHVLGTKPNQSRLLFLIFIIYIKYAECRI